MESLHAIKPSEAIALLRADATNLNGFREMSSEDSDRFGVASMSGRLERVAVRKPSAILRADAAEWHYEKYWIRRGYSASFLRLLHC